MKDAQGVKTPDRKKAYPGLAKEDLAVLSKRPDPG